MVDSVIDGRTGILVRPGDPRDLARGILELLRDPDRAAALGRAGRELMLSHFTLGTTVRELAALYRRQLDAAPAAFRPHAFILRLGGAALLAPFILARAIFDYAATGFVPERLAALRRSLRQGRGPARPRS
jgi:hypothetical protein